MITMSDGAGPPETPCTPPLIAIRNQQSRSSISIRGPDPKSPSPRPVHLLNRSGAGPCVRAYSMLLFPSSPRKKQVGRVVPRARKGPFVSAVEKSEEVAQIFPIYR